MKNQKTSSDKEKNEYIKVAKSLHVRIMNSKQHGGKNVSHNFQHFTKVRHSCFNGVFYLLLLHNFHFVFNPF